MQVFWNVLLQMTNNLHMATEKKVSVIYVKVSVFTKSKESTPNLKQYQGAS